MSTTTPLMVLSVVTYPTCKGPKLDAYMFQNVTSIIYQYDFFLVNIDKFLNIIWITIWHFAQHIGMLEMIVLCFSMHEDDIIEHTNGKCHVFTFLYGRGVYSWPSVIVYTLINLYTTV